MLLDEHYLKRRAESEHFSGGERIGIITASQRIKLLDKGVLIHDDLLNLSRIPQWFREYFISIGSFIETRRDAETQRIPFKVENLDTATYIFPIEKQKLVNTLRNASNYMSAEGLTSFARACALNVIAHARQYRKSTYPYPWHTLGVTEELVKMGMDSPTACAGVLHDSKEDTFVTPDIIFKNVDPDPEIGAAINKTIEGCTNVSQKGRDKAWNDEQTRRKIILELINNPAVPTIKIKDRLKNLEDIEFMSTAKKRAKIDETQALYVPMALLMGLYEDAKKLDELVLRKRSKNHDKIADSIVRGMKLFRRNTPSWQIEHDISTNLKETIDRIWTESRVSIHPRRQKAAFATGPVRTLFERKQEHDHSSLGNFTVKIREPNIHDVFRRMGERRVPVSSDYYYNVDLIMDQFPQDVAPGAWGNAALSIYNKFFLMDNEFRLVGKLDEDLFTKELKYDLTDYLSFNVQRQSDGLELHIRVYPRFAYDLTQVPLSNLYYHRQTAPEEWELSPSMDTSDEVSQRHIKAVRKHRKIRDRLSRAISDPLLSSIGIMRNLEPRLGVSDIRVVGIDDKGTEEPHTVMRGSSVLDYTKDISPGFWQTATGFMVNSEQKLLYINGVPVSDWGFQLSPGDRVHIDFDPERQPHWNPYWIHQFRVDKEGMAAVKSVYERMRNQADARDRVGLETLLAEIGLWRLEQELPPHERPLRTGLDRASFVYNERKKDDDPQVTERDFLIKVGLGRVSDITIKRVVEVAREINKNVAVMIFTFFDTSEYGQAASILRVAERMKINLPIEEARSLTRKSGPSVVKLYLDPDDYDQLGRKLWEAVIGDSDCRRAGLTAVDVLQNGHSVFRSLNLDMNNK